MGLMALDNTQTNTHRHICTQTQLGAHRNIDKDIDKDTDTEKATDTDNVSTVCMAQWFCNWLLKCCIAALSGFW